MKMSQQVTEPAVSALLVEKGHFLSMSALSSLTLKILIFIVAMFLFLQVS